MELIARGHKVNYYVRKDGGLVIHTIDGTHYSGKTGNVVARKILGIEISERRASQLSRINKEAKKIKAGELEKTKSLPEKIKEQWDKTNKALRKAYKHATITKRQVQQMLEEMGIEKTLDYLKEQERRSKGYAYHTFVDGLIARILEVKLSAPVEDHEYLDGAVEKISEVKGCRNNV